MSRMSRKIHVWRYNPSEESTGWIVGGAIGFIVVLGILSAMRPAQAANMGPPPTPNPPPTPRPRPTSPDLVFTPEEAAAIGGARHNLVLQADLTPTEVQSTRAIRVLQQQLADLGYDIPAVDGRPSPALGRATAQFLADQGLPANSDNLTLLLAVDSRYEHVFGGQGYVG